MVIGLYIDGERAWGDAWPDGGTSLRHVEVSGRYRERANTRRGTEHEMACHTTK